MVLCIGLSCSMSPVKTDAQVITVITTVIKKVLVAIDLQVQRLQTKTIGLQNVQKAIENTMSKLNLTDISDWVQKQKDLYDNYYQELWKVKAAIAYYTRVKKIITEQLDLVNAYKKGFALLKQDRHFTAGELGYMYTVYSGILGESVKNLDQIYLVINAFATQMSDAERLRIIDEAASRIDRNYADVKQFTNDNIRLSLQRSKDDNDLFTVKQLYNLP